MNSDMRALLYWTVIVAGIGAFAISSWAFFSGHLTEEHYYVDAYLYEKDDLSWKPPHPYQVDPDTKHRLWFSLIPTNPKAGLYEGLYRIGPVHAQKDVHEALQVNKWYRVRLSWSEYYSYPKWKLTYVERESTDPREKP